MTFSDYMIKMRIKYRAKATDISAETGISLNYLYRILNGYKRTATRDYIILICRSIGMSVEETNKALRLNQMPALRNERDQIIARCITDNRTIRMINESLEEAGWSELKFCKEEL